jgi:hypothetical protein
MPENNKKTKELSMISPKVEFKALIANTPKNVIPESLMGDKPQKRDMISRTQSTSDSSQASDNSDD